MEVQNLAVYFEEGTSWTLNIYTLPILLRWQSKGS
jgi:hypothetical protein